MWQAAFSKRTALRGCGRVLSSSRAKIESLGRLTTPLKTLKKFEHPVTQPLTPRTGARVTIVCQSVSTTRARDHQVQLGRTASQETAPLNLPYGPSRPIATRRKKARKKEDCSARGATVASGAHEQEPRGKDLSFGSVWLAAVKLDSNKQFASRLHRGYRRLKKLFKCVANQTLTASPQPAVTTTTATTTTTAAAAVAAAAAATVEEPVIAMSPPSEEESSGLVLALAAANAAPANNTTATAAPTGVSAASAAAPANVPGTTLVPQMPHKRSHKDFIFGKVIGEGSFSTVYLAKDIHTTKEYAIKVCEKRHIIREKKPEYVRREKEVLNMLAGAKHSFVKLFCTFQDIDRLYFVLSYAKNGELLPYINKVGSFDIECTKFYSAEILRGLEYLHGLGVIHRDLKPENILLDENMHTLITDFGSTKILRDEPEPQTQQSNPDQPNRRERRNSFVGTAQYVSPEHLTEKTSSRASDLWALGCIIYQMVSGLPPFHARSEYLVFQKVLKGEYEIPEGFSPLAKDIVAKFLVLNPNDRLGATDEHGAGYPSIRAHPLFAGVDFETLHEQTPPPIYPYLPGTSEHEELRSNYRVPDNLEPGLDDKQLTRLLGLGIGEPSDEDEEEDAGNTEQQQKQQEEEKRKIERRERRLKLEKPRKKPGVMDFSKDDFVRRLEDQKVNSPWHRYVQGNLIIKEGYVNKRKGLFARRRMLLLTTGPHLYYVDASSSILKGEIPWSKELRVEPKNFKIFFVHTPNRTYYLEDPEGFALDWCQAIEETRVYYFGAKEQP